MTREWSGRFEVGIWGIAICIAIPYVLAYARYLRKWFIRERGRTPERRDEDAKEGR